MNLKFIILIPLVFSFYNLCAQNYTGQRIYSSKFPSEIKDSEQDTYIKINNSCYDCYNIVVAIEDFYRNRVIQHAFIKKGSNYSFKNLPVGTYFCKYLWTDEYGKKHYQKDNSKMQYKLDEVGGYEIILEKTQHGNLTKSTIDEDDFFK